MLDTSKCVGCDYIGIANLHNTCHCFADYTCKYLDGMEKCPLEELKGEKMNVIEKIGEAALLEQTAEECVELAKELLKMARKIRKENPTPTKLKTIKKHLWEETADVLLCLDMLDDAGFIPQEEVMGIYRQKEERMNKRLGVE